MAQHARIDENRVSIRVSPDPETRERQIINAAYDLAEKQILEGTASSQVITHFLKMGTAERELEREKLRREVALIEAKTDALESAKRLEALYADAINARKRYQGVGEEEYEDE